MLEKLGSPVDAVVVLAYAERDKLFELAKRLPEVDVIMGGPTGQTVTPTKAGAVWVVSATNKGKFVAQMRFDDSADPRWVGAIREVNDGLADDSNQVANLAAFHQVLAAADFVATETGLKNQIGLGMNRQNEYAGNESCQKCHVADCEHFVGTKHAIAWVTLEAKGTQVDPYCQQCHTTGYGAKGGFMSMEQSQARVNVGCESCHGPGANHNADPRVRTLFVAKDQCVRCHDRENSPAFDYEEYWKKIVHGAKVELPNNEQELMP